MSPKFGMGRQRCRVNVFLKLQSLALPLRRCACRGRHQPYPVNPATKHVERLRGSMTTAPSDRCSLHLIGDNSSAYTTTANSSFSVHDSYLARLAESKDSRSKYTVSNSNGCTFGTAAHDPQPKHKASRRNLLYFGTAVSRYLSDGERVDSCASRGLEEPPGHPRATAHAVAHRGGNNAARAGWTRQEGRDRHRTKPATAKRQGVSNKKLRYRLCVSVLSRGVYPPTWRCSRRKHPKEKQKMSYCTGCCIVVCFQDVAVQVTYRTRSTSSGPVFPCSHLITPTATDSFSDLHRKRLLGDRLRRRGPCLTPVLRRRLCG